MKKTKLTRSLLAACSIVALSVAVYGCDSGPSQSEYDEVKAEADANAEAAAAAAAAQAQAESAAAAAAAAQAEAEAATAAAAAAQAEAEAKAAADVAAAEAAAMAAAAAQAAAEAAAAAQAEADAAALQAAVDAAAAAAEQAAMAATEAAEAKAAAEKAAADLAAAETARMEAEAAAEAAKMAQEEAEERARMAEEGETETQGELDAAAAAAASAKAKALKGAIGSAPLASLVDIAAAAPLPAVPSLTPTGLMLGTPPRDAATGLIAATGDPSRTPRMAPGESVGMLGDWAGTNYSYTDPVTGVTNSAVAYRNRAAAIMIPFAEGASFGADEAAFEAAYTRATRTLALGADLANSFAIAGDMFPTAGSMAYTGTTGVPSVVIPGTYQGAEGDYYCSGTGCTATVTSAGAITLGGTWHFVHDEGAMITSPDSSYLYFGWWLQDDGAGSPKYASAFTDGVSPTAATAIGVPGTDATALNGSATYAGHAAGKFAISNPIGDDDAGHFTADAMLTATFGSNDAPNFGGLSGTLDNFMLNDSGEDAGWEVSLQRRLWGGAGATWTVVAPADDAATPGFDESMGTIWSIDGNAAAESGSWTATMYDETTVALGAPNGSAVPDSVTGTFHATFGAFASMVGAFGAERTME